MPTFLLSNPELAAHRKDDVLLVTYMTMLGILDRQGMPTFPLPYPDLAAHRKNDLLLVTYTAMLGILDHHGK